MTPQQVVNRAAKAIMRVPKAQLVTKRGRKRWVHLTVPFKAGHEAEAIGALSRGVRDRKLRYFLPFGHTGDHWVTMAHIVTATGNGVSVRMVQQYQVWDDKVLNRLDVLGAP